jgi:hypothetical protein
MSYIDTNTMNRVINMFVFYMPDRVLQYTLPFETYCVLVCSVSKAIVQFVVNNFQVFVGMVLYSIQFMDKY